MGRKVVLLEAVECNGVTPFFRLPPRKNANCCLIVDKTNGFVNFRWEGVCKHI